MIPHLKNQSSHSLDPTSMLGFKDWKINQFSSYNHSESTTNTDTDTNVTQTDSDHNYLNKYDTDTNVTQTDSDHNYLNTYDTETETDSTCNIKIINVALNEQSLLDKIIKDIDLLNKSDFMRLYYYICDSKEALKKDNIIAFYALDRYVKNPHIIKNKVYKWRENIKKTKTINIIKK